MKKLLLICITSPLLLALSACSAGTAAGTGSGINQPVLAQTTYSSASLSGTYSIEYMCTYCDTTGTGNSYDAGVGTLQLNGSGAINGGTLNIYNSYATKPCVYSVTGTYSIQSTALGTASLSLSSSTTGCTPTTNWQLALAAADGGAAIQFTRSDGYMASGSAIKQ